MQLFSPDLLGLGGRLAYAVGLFGGDGRNRIATRPGVLGVVRLQWSPLGAFDDLVEADLERRPEPRLALAVAGALNVNTERQRSTHGPVLARAVPSYRHAMADCLFKLRGLSLLGEALVRSAAVSNDALFNAWGWFVQGGYAATSTFEIVARYGDLHPLGDLSRVARSREAGGGLNWYLSQHDFKLQADYFALLGEDPAPVRHQVRLQLQVYL